MGEREGEKERQREGERQVSILRAFNKGLWMTTLQGLSRLQLIKVTICVCVRVYVCVIQLSPAEGDCT